MVKMSINSNKCFLDYIRMLLFTTGVGSNEEEIEQWSPIGFSFKQFGCYRDRSTLFLDRPFNLYFNFDILQVHFPAEGSFVVLIE